MVGSLSKVALPFRPTTCKRDGDRSTTLRRRDVDAGNKTIDPYDYIRRGNSSEKVGCSIRWKREQPSMRVVTVKFGRSKSEWMYIKSRSATRILLREGLKMENFGDDVVLMA